MVTDFRLEEERRWEDLKSLKRHLNSNQKTINTIHLHRTQTCADAAAEIQEAGGLTITHLAAKADLEVWAENDHADAQGLAISGEYVDENHEIVEFSGTLNEVDSQTSEPLITGEFLDLRSAVLETAQDADGGYIAVGNNAKNAWYGVIEQGNLYSIHSRHHCIADRRTFLGPIVVQKPEETAVVTVHVTCTPKTSGEAMVFNLSSIKSYQEYNPIIELEEGSIISFTIEDDNAAHPVADIDITIIESY